MDNMEEYTVSNDLSACGLPGNYDVTAGTKALFSSVVPLINVEVVMMPASVGTGRERRAKAGRPAWGRAACPQHVECPSFCLLLCA